MRKKPIRAITFDLWLTLIWDSKELEEYRKLRRLINFHRFVRRISGPRPSTGKKSSSDKNPVTFNSLRLAMEELSVKVKELYERNLDISSEERGRMLFEILGIKLASRKESIPVYSQAGRILSDAGYLRRHPNLNPEAIPTLQQLKKNFPFLKVGLISNAARSKRTYERLFSSLGIGPYFDSLTISSEVGYLKPRREIFEAALKSLELNDPAEAMHVGDLFRADVVGATNSGMNALLYTGLWHRYAPDMAPGEHIPSSFRAPKELFVKEISNLGQVVEIVKNFQS